MKAIALIITFIATILLGSCKKDSQIGQIEFSIGCAKQSDTTMYDSVSFLVIKYAESKDLKDYSKDYYDPNVYSKVLKLKIVRNGSGFMAEPLSFHDGYIMFIKSFELTNNNDKVFYYIPFNTAPEYQYYAAGTHTPMPFWVDFNEYTTSIDMLVTKKE
jgi:hypothetical protein